MSNKYSVFPVLFCLLLISNNVYCQLSADDFFSPPVKSETEQEKNSLLKIRNPEKVIVESNMVKAETSQDGINYILKKHSDGNPFAERFTSKKGGVGVVSRGVAYYEKYPNSTATMKSKRIAYVKAYTSAMVNLKEYENGSEIESSVSVNEYMKSVSTEDKTDSIFKSSIEDNKKNVVKGNLRGHVVYLIDEDTKDNRISVVIASTPNTKRKIMRINSVGMIVDSKNEGLNNIFLEIDKKILPPTGNKIIHCKKTGEIYYVGFGSSIIAQFPEPSVQQKTTEMAKKQSELDAKASLLQAIQGVNMNHELTVLEPETKEELTDDSSFFSSVNEITQKSKFYIKGKLPPNVLVKTYISKDKWWAISVAVWCPNF